VFGSSRHLAAPDAHEKSCFVKNRTIGNSAIVPLSAGGFVAGHFSLSPLLHAAVTTMPADLRAADVALWREAQQNEVQMKRNLSSTSLDESPVSIDAVFHEPMVPHKTEDGDSGWLVSVGDDDVEVMPELFSAPVNRSAPIKSSLLAALPSAAELQSRRVRDLAASLGNSDGVEDSLRPMRTRSLTDRLYILRDEQDWHVRRAEQLDALIGETRAAIDEARAEQLAQLARLAMQKPNSEEEEELTIC